ncbi:hypothetical protein QOT17_002701 [Balamuthia mandrillaris]
MAEEEKKSGTAAVAAADFCEYLPGELCLHIFSFLDLKSMPSALVVSAAWRGLAGDNHVWYHRYSRLFPLSYRLPPLLLLPAEEAAAAAEAAVSSSAPRPGEPEQPPPREQEEVGLQDTYSDPQQPRNVDMNDQQQPYDEHEPPPLPSSSSYSAASHETTRLEREEEREERTRFPRFVTNLHHALLRHHKALHHRRQQQQDQQEQQAGGGAPSPPPASFWRDVLALRHKLDAKWKRAFQLAAFAQELLRLSVDPKYLKLFMMRKAKFFFDLGEDYSNHKDKELHSDMCFLVAFEALCTLPTFWRSIDGKSSEPQWDVVHVLAHRLMVHGHIKYPKRNDVGTAEMLIRECCFVCEKARQNGYTDLGDNWGAAILCLAVLLQNCPAVAAQAYLTGLFCYFLFSSFAPLFVLSALSFFKKDESFNGGLEASVVSEIEQQQQQQWAEEKKHEAEQQRKMEAEVLFSKAEAMFLNLDDFNKWKYFNMACLSSLRKREEQCKYWLGQCEERGYLTRGSMWGDVFADSDLDWARERSWFAEMRERVEKERARRAEEEGYDFDEEEVYYEEEDAEM